jgi:two-component system sensor histidine kinase UhpB
MKELKILYLEDSAQDAELASYLLKSAGIDHVFKLVDAQDEYQEALKQYQPDLVLADHSLFHFNSVEALRIFKATGLKVPFILVTGTVSEEFAVNILKQGADDYLLKDNLVRLPTAIINSLEKYRLEREKQEYLENIIANESLMREAERLSHFGSWEADIATGEIKWSDGMFRIYGYEPGEVKPGHDIILRHIHPEDRRLYQHAIYSELGTVDLVESEIRINDRNDISKSVYSKIVVKRNSEGQLTRLLGFMQDITEKRAMEKELAQQALVQQKLITEVTIQAQEKERNWIGGELHDNINQILASVKMFMGMAGDYPDKREELMKRAVTNVNHAIDEIRKLSKSLVAPSIGDIGLIGALQELVNEVNLEKKLNIELAAEVGDEKNVDKNMELVLYRIAQEQLNNIGKYAKASHVVITLRADEMEVFFSIDDDGVGFDVTRKSKGIGLKNIRSRVDFYAGKMMIVSAPGKGCSLTITIPR